MWSVPVARVPLIVGGALTVLAAGAAVPSTANVSEPTRAAAPLPTLTLAPVPDAAPATAVPPAPRVTQVGTTTSAAAARAGSSSRTGYTEAAAIADAEWILRAQLPNGAIATHVDRAHVYPYLANFAALGLARASAQTGDRRYLRAAWRHLDWYAAHMNRRGYVTDYAVDSRARMRSTGTMDSTDAYAGTFLLAVRAAHRVGHDDAKLRGIRRGVAKAVAAIRSTQDRDGLTWAKPSWRVKYLMDQAETLAGLRAATYLARQLGATGLAHRSSASARRLQRGVDSLWNPRTGAYDWAVHANGVRVATDWNRLYPDALQQAWAVAFGLVPERRATPLMRRFERRQPHWDQPRRTARYDDGRRRVGYWAPVGWALQRAGLRSAGAHGFRSIRAAALAHDRLWPFTPSDSGQLIVLGNGALSDLTP